ncbi:MFS transporter [Alcaligenaceae bacterium]|nr:MFS transporter [Alcaligenaceae bacterium]
MPLDIAEPSPFLRRWGGFVAVSFALGLGFATSSLPTPLYPVYQDQWHLLPSELTYIYALYMVGVLFALLFFGRLSDTLGRYAVVCLSLVMITGGLIMSGAASSINTLFVARIIIGFANGLLTTAGTLALADAHPRKDRRVASIVTSASIALGVGIGPLLGGLLAQTGFAPLRLSYFVIAALALGNLYLTWRCRHKLRQQAGPRARLSISPKLALPSAQTRTPFLLASIAAFLMFSTGSLLASLIPSFLYDLLPWQGPAVPGVAFLIMALAASTTQFSQRNLPAVKGLAIGLATLIMFLIAVSIGVISGSIIAFTACMILAGVGQGLCFMTATMIAAQSADDHRRSANMATFFAIAYIGGTVPVIVVGQLADIWGMTTAILVFCALAAVAVCGLVYQVLRLMRAQVGI